MLKANLDGAITFVTYEHVATTNPTGVIDAESKSRWSCYFRALCSYQASLHFMISGGNCKENVEWTSLGKIVTTTCFLSDHRHPDTWIDKDRCSIFWVDLVDQSTRAALPLNTYEEVSTACMSHTEEIDLGNSTPTQRCSNKITWKHHKWSTVNECWQRIYCHDENDEVDKWDE